MLNLLVHQAKSGYQKVNKIYYKQNACFIHVHDYSSHHFSPGKYLASYAEDARMYAALPFRNVSVIWVENVQDFFVAFSDMKFHTKSVPRFSIWYKRRDRRMGGRSHYNRRPAKTRNAPKNASVRP